MKICISSLGNNIESEVDPRFGRCQYFIIYDTDKDSSESVKNENVMTRGGAGIQSAQLIAEKEAEVVLTGNVGPNAHQTLEAAGIKVITGVVGKIKEVIEKFKKGEYRSTENPNVDAKFGMQKPERPDEKEE
jgi:predicted Fe-Mo cluster-binding NifX family protein